MGKLIAIVGASGVGKTSLVHALSKTAQFATAYEEHTERPFQNLFKQNPYYAFANQMDYLLYRAEQEYRLRTSPQLGLIDGGLDLDFHGFTRLFHARSWLTDNEFDLCRRFYLHTRELLPLPELIVHLTTSEGMIRERLAKRDRINIVSAEDTKLFNSFLREWLAGISSEKLLTLDVTSEDTDYKMSVTVILDTIPSIA